MTVTLIECVGCGNLVDRKECYRGRRECKECSRKYRRNWTYGITDDIFEEIYVQQDGRCAACREPFEAKSGRSIQIDHDHGCCPRQGSCGACIRGLLCFGCNAALGLVGDNGDRLRRLADYLDQESGS